MIARDQALLVYEVAEDTVLTLNGLYAHAYPTEEGVCLTNNPFTDEEDFDEIVVSYQDFYSTVRNQNGKFLT